VTGQWFSLGPPVSSTNKTACHDTTEILLKVALNTIEYVCCLFAIHQHNELDFTQVKSPQ
jgi:hypothetical protein